MRQRRRRVGWRRMRRQGRRQGRRRRTQVPWAQGVSPSALAFPLFRKKASCF